MGFISAFARNDLKNIRRDSLLLYILLIPWLVIAIMRLLLPVASEWSATVHSFPLEPYYPLILSIVFVLQFPMMFGLIFGLLLLDERDEHVLMAINVTPVSVDRYVQYRFLSVTTLGIIYVMIGLPASGLIPPGIVLSLFPVAITGAFFANLLLLFLISFANNKVEGLALMKGFGILMIGPMVAFFFESNWQLLFGILPSYWPAKAYWLVSAGENAWPYIFISLFYNSLLLRLMYTRFAKRLYK